MSLMPISLRLKSDRNRWLANIAWIVVIEVGLMDETFEISYYC